MIKTLRGYELIAEIGAGGFGSVYRAYQPIIDREVAIKIIPAKVANQVNFVRNFESEARLVARLEHPHIVPLFDYWRDTEGAYLVQRLLRGGSLEDLLKKGRPKIEMVVRLMEQVAEALAVAHRQGVVHRDIKPANILMDEEGNAYLADFGIATLTGRQEEGQMVGSLGYMAPELIGGDPPTLSCDIYSLGIMLYELATARHPFGEVDVTEMIIRHLEDPIPDPNMMYADLPPQLNMVIQKATAKNAEDRYMTVQDLVEDLRQVLSHEITRPIVIERNPYKGLRAFDEADTQDFFGREVLIDAMLDRLRQERFLAVVGPSGSGKSSVVKAGLLPALRSGRLPGSESWFIVEMVPGAHPLQKLMTALMSIAVDIPPVSTDNLEQDPYGLLLLVDQILSQLDEDSKLVVFIDQFEEVFTLVESEQERKFFLNVLHTALMSGMSKLRVIITIRADFYDRPLQYEDIGALVQSRTQVVLPLSANEIERAITGPAERVGLEVDGDLIAQIVADVREEPGALPLLQYALTEVYERREADHLTIGAYLSSGGVLGALARRAEDVFKGLTPPQREQAKQIFLRLVSLGEGTEDTRRRARLQEIITLASEKSAIQEVLDIFDKYRLLTFDREPMSREPTVEVAHEALIRTWDRMRLWLNESRNDIRLQRLLATSAQEWKDAKQKKEFLLSGGRLAQFEDWLKTSSISLTPLEREYVTASSTERLNQEAQERERTEREIALQKRARRFLTILAGVMAVGIILSLIMTGVIFRQSEETAEARDSAERNASEAQSLALAASARQAFQSGNPDLALTLALAATNSDAPPTDAYRTLAQIAYAPGTNRIFETQPAPVRDVSVSPDGRYILSGVGRLRLSEPVTEDNRLTLWDAQTGEVVHYLEGHTDSVLDAAFSPDGAIVATTARDNQLILWDVASGEEIRRIELNSPEDYIFSLNVTFTPDGEHLLTAGSAFPIATWSDWNEGVLIPPTLWDVETGEASETFDDFDPAITAVIGEIGILPDGKSAIINGWDFSRRNTYNWQVIHFSLDNGEEIQRFLPEHTANLRPFQMGMTLSKDGTRLAVSKADGSGVLQIFDVESGDSIKQLSGGLATNINSMAFSPDGYRLLVGTSTTNVLLIDAQTLELLRPLNGHEASVLTVAFTADGQNALSGALDGSIRQWNLETQAQIAQFNDHATQVNLIVAHNHIAISAGGGVDTLFNAEGNAVLVWDTAEGKVIHRLVGHILPALTADISPDGQLALSGGIASLKYDGILIIWDLATGEEVRRVELTDAATMITNAFFTPDGNIIAALYNGSVIKIETASGETTAVLVEPSENGVAAFNVMAVSPDGTTFINSFNRGAVNLYDAETGEIIAEIARNVDISEALYSPDGQTFLLITNDNTFSLWDIATRTRLRRFVGHTAAVTGADFTDDGSQIISSAADNTLILWDTLTGLPLQYFEGHGDDVQDVVVIGSEALSAGKDGTLIQWNIQPLPLADLIPWAYDHRYVRGLTSEECVQYRLEDRCETALPRISKAVQ